MMSPPAFAGRAPAQRSSPRSPGGRGEAPADRAALQSLRSVPGFDEVVKKIYGASSGVGRFLTLRRMRARRADPVPRLNQL